MIRKVAQTIARHEMVRRGDRVAVAVSGGPDSVALLHVLRELARDLDISLAIAHLNHRLRGDESDEDQAFVQGLASELELKCLLHAVDVRAEVERRRENLEQTARQARHQWFHLLIRDGLADKVAVGHTRSDQAETVLYRLLRGAGSAGLSGVHPVLGGELVRPLLDVSRAEVTAYLEAGGHAWREDSSNADEQFDRNRLRHRLMPLLAQDWNPNVEQTLARIADWAQAEEAYWAESLPTLVSEIVESGPAGAGFSARRVAELPLAVQRRLLRAVLDQVRGDLLGIGFKHIENLRRLLATGCGTGSVHLPGATARRSFDRVLVAPADPAGELAPGGFSLEVDVPGRVEIPGTSSVLVLRLLHRVDVKDGYNSKQAQILDWNKVPKPLRLRSWRAGDSYCPLGRSRPKKLKLLFQERHIEAWKRARWPVVTGWCDKAERGSREDQGAETIVWTRGFGPAEQFAAREGAETFLEISESG